MDYETVVPELFQRFPKLRSVWETRFSSVKAETSIQPMVFESVLIPALEEALATSNLGKILPICAFLEDVAEAAHHDSALKSLLQVEVGEWLGGAAHESLLAPWLGTETKRICGYVPGLATQRIEPRREPEKRSLVRRISTFLKQFHRR